MAFENRECCYCRRGFDTRSKCERHILECHGDRLNIVSTVSTVITDDFKDHPGPQGCPDKEESAEEQVIIKTEPMSDQEENDMS